MTKKMNDLEWTRPVLNSETHNSDTSNITKKSKAAWTSVAIGVVTKKILQNDAVDEYPFLVDKD